MDEKLEQREQRTQLVEMWRNSEKTAERVGGLLLILATAITMILEAGTGDSLTIMQVALMMAGGFTLIFRSRRSADQRKHLMFIGAHQQSQRSWMAFIGAGVLMVFAIQQGRAGFFVLAGLGALLGVWFRWRNQQVQAYDALFPKPTLNSDDTPPNTQSDEMHHDEA